MKALPDPPAPPTEAGVLAAIEAAGEAGLKKAPLAKALLAGRRVAKAARLEFDAAVARVLGELSARGAVVNFGTAASPRLVSARSDRRLLLACENLEGRATPGRATAFTIAALRQGHRKSIGKAIVDEAVQRLVAERKLIGIQPGKTVFYVHARSLAPLIFGGSTEASKERVFAPAAVRQAYAELVRSGGFEDVQISDLQERSGAALDGMKAWLLEQSRAGRAVPTRGDWSLASPAARSAAIEIRGEPHLQVRLLEDR